MNQQNLVDQLINHPIYISLKSVEQLKIFMSFHVYAVWDFMSLLKALQREITCVTVPWRPSTYPKELVRFINEIVLGEESDLTDSGTYSDHFSLYCEAMKELGLETESVEYAVRNLDFSSTPKVVQQFVSHHLRLAQSGEAHRVAASFFYGREKLIPEIFKPLLEQINKFQYPSLHYYLDRHIQIDGEEHGPLAKKCLDILCAESPIKHQEAQEEAINSLSLRLQLWDAAYVQIIKDQRMDSVDRISPIL